MRLLSVDTTTRWGSVALLRDGSVDGEIRLHEETHSRTVFPAIEHLLNAAGVAIREIDAFAVAVGPGSFTGVRVGISTIQGLALGTGRPCVALSGLLGLAGKMQGEADTLVPLMDAYREQVFSAVYDAELRSVREPAASTVEDVFEGLAGRRVALLGDGALRYRDRILAREPAAILPQRSFFLAASLGRIAFERLQDGGGEEAAALRPLYLRAPDIRTSAKAPVNP